MKYFLKLFLTYIALSLIFSAVYFLIILGFGYGQNSIMVFLGVSIEMGFGAVFVLSIIGYVCALIGK